MSLGPQLAQEVISKYQEIQTSNNTEIIQIATDWLEQFYHSPPALAVLMMIIRTYPVPLYREHAAIGLSRAINYAWMNLVEQEQESVVHNLISLVCGESNEGTRKQIISALKLVISDKFVQPLLSGITGSTSLDIAIELASLLCKCEDARTDLSISSVMSDLLNRGFHSELCQTKLNAFAFLAQACEFRMLESIDFFWPACIELFDQCIQDTNHFSIYRKVFNDLLESSEHMIHPEPILERCLVIFFQQETDPNLLLEMFSMVTMICESYPRIIRSNGIYIRVIQIDFNLFYYWFDPADPNPMANLQFFEPGLTTLCTSNTDSDSAPPAVLSVIYQFCVQVAVSDPTGQFASLCALKAIAEYSGRFFDPYIKDIIAFFSTCLQSALPCIRETAISAINEFSPIIQRSKPDGIFELTVQILQIAQVNPSTEIFISFSSLLLSLNSSADIFDDTFALCVAVLQLTPSVALQSAIVNCLTSLVLRSKEKTAEYVHPLLEICETSLNFEETRVPAVNCLEAILSMFPRELLQEESVFHFLIGNIKSDDPDLSLACLSAVDTVLNVLPEAISRFPPTEIAFIRDLAAIDFSTLFSESISKGSDECVSFQPKFKASAMALRLLSRCVLLSADLFQTYGNDCLRACTVHIDSVQSECQLEAVQALSNFADAIIKFNHATEETTAQIIQTLLMIYEKSRPYIMEHNLLLKIIDVIRKVIIEINSPVNNGIILEVIHKLYDEFKSNFPLGDVQVLICILRLIKKVSKRLIPSPSITPPESSPPGISFFTVIIIGFPGVNLTPFLDGLIQSMSEGPAPSSYWIIRKLIKIHPQLVLPRAQEIIPLIITCLQNVENDEIRFLGLDTMMALFMTTQERNLHTLFELLPVDSIIQSSVLTRFLVYASGIPESVPDVIRCTSMALLTGIRGPDEIISRLKEALKAILTANPALAESACGSSESLMQVLHKFIS